MIEAASWHFSSRQLRGTRAARPRRGWVGGAFVYQSQTGPKEPGGSFGGELTLVPGTIKEPTGPPFDVPVLPFSLSVPSFLY